MQVVDRTIIYSGEITAELSCDFVSELLRLQQQKWPINIVCASSIGGDADAALAMIDYIRNSPNQIDFYGSGALCSSQALISLAADNVYLTSETAYFLFHKGEMSYEGNLQNKGELSGFMKTAEALDFQNRWDAQWISDNSVKPPNYWRERLEKDSEVYIFAEEALELELIDAIKSYS